MLLKSSLRASASRFAVNRLLDVRDIHPRRLASTCAVALDVDGVLLRGPKALPGAKLALETLRQNKIPFLLLTNGGGYIEADKAAQIGKIIDMDIPAEQLQVAHTPFKGLAREYGDKPVLLVGKSRIHKIARSYGFKNTYDISDLHHQWPSLFPDWAPLSKTGEFQDVPSEPRRLTEPIACALTFMDPMHYHRDMQVLIDVLRSNGLPGTLVPKQQVPVYFAGPDLEYVTDHPVPRFGSGIFADLVDFFYTRVTGTPLRRIMFGKPFPETYTFATQTLTDAAKAAGYDKLHKVYMIGDNPKSDIRGANEAGWHSILLRTGMFQGPPGSNDPEDPARDVVDTVMDAVQLIVKQEAGRV